MAVFLVEMAHQVTGATVFLVVLFKLGIVDIGFLIVDPSAYMLVFFLDDKGQSALERSLLHYRVASRLFEA
jgi:hypothetical protein